MHYHGIKFLPQLGRFIAAFIFARPVSLDARPYFDHDFENKISNFYENHKDKINEEVELTVLNGNNNIEI